MRVPTQYLFPGVLAGVVALAAGCGPAGNPLPERVTEDDGDAGLRGGGEAARPDLIDRVREGPGGPDGAGYARWIEQQLAAAGGTLMFADWDVLPRETDDEVRFTYTLLDADYRVLTGTYVWEVSRDGGEVGAPRQVRPGVRSAAAGDQARGGFGE